jgi:hypothetical protein
MSEVQWCQLCREHVEDVEPAKVRGGKMLMVCTQCRSHFEEKVKVEWGRHADFQYYWDLGKPILKPPARHVTSKLLGVRLGRDGVAKLRAAGFTLWEVKDE